MLWAAPATYLLIASLVLVVAAKASVLASMHDVSRWPLVWLRSISPDVTLHAGLAALFAMGEWRRRWLAAATVLVAGIVSAVAVINAAHLATTGEQLSWEAVQYGLASRTALLGIVAESLARHLPLALFGAALAVLMPFAARRVLQRRQLTRACAAHAAAMLAVAASAVWLLAPAPDTFAAAAMGRSATLHTYWSWATDAAPSSATGSPIVEFLGYQPERLVSDADVAELSARSRPNLVLLVLESTRRDVTGLAEPPGAAATPNLVALARRGTEVPVTRAALPHTTKSLFSMLCARLPLMQREPVEVSQAVRVECLPRILAGAGYATAFFQSAVGSFEHRPRLVSQLGYGHFEAWEEVRGEPLGYLASDDESLAGPFDRWLDAAPAPFFATLLTSATHHPYRLPLDPNGAAVTGTDEQRYARLVEAGDRLLGALLETLERRGLVENTIVVVAGDHGEGFGAKGVRQHDNNFFEEGLRVPLVFSGPGVPTGRVQGNASLVDLTPSLLDLLGLPVPELRIAGVPLAVSLFDGAVPDVPRWFGCFYERSCRGFVLDTRKVLAVPETGRTFYLDLEADPDERQALPLTADLAAHLPALDLAIDSHRTRRWPFVLGAVRGYGSWSCPPDEWCRHPASPPDGFFEPTVP
jgi:glucan phosphoethanolaminetransferase (alkaline phosphatase superfamily)